MKNRIEKFKQLIIYISKRGSQNYQNMIQREKDMEL